jgi:hypothetical protein
MKRKITARKKAAPLRKRAHASKISLAGGDTNFAPSRERDFREVLALIERARERAYHAVNTELMEIYS